jgi:acyl carrier protein
MSTSVSSAGDTLSRIKCLIAEVCAVAPETIGTSARLRGYGIDSIRALDLMVSVEEEFEVQFRVEDLENIHTVGDLADYVERLRTRAAHSAR